MQAAANFINNGRYQEAINVLNGIDNKTAQWYYYSAIANSGIGNNVIALQHAREAARMEPNNIQYTTLVQRLENGGNWYRQQQGPLPDNLLKQRRLVRKTMYRQPRL